jgi:hypothetical protein
MQAVTVVHTIAIGLKTGRWVITVAQHTRGVNTHDSNGHVRALEKRDHKVVFVDLKDTQQRS